MSILLATGVNYEITLAPSPITDAEIDRFIEMLDDDDWFSRLTTLS
ncbi:MAG: hypothetical protein V3S28_07685 [Acidimicrobiia bacterium]